MKHYLKFAIALIMGIVALGFQSCGDDEEDGPDVKIKVTQSEIQGNWHSAYNRMFYRISFDGDDYSYYIMDVRTSNIEYREYGTYTLNGTEIKFNSTDGSSRIGGTGECEIYWENSYKSQLHIYPAGTFERSTN